MIGLRNRGHAIATARSDRTTAFRDWDRAPYWSAWLCGRIPEVSDRPTQAELDAIAGMYGVKVGSANVLVPDLSGGPLTRTAKISALALPLRVYANDEWLVFEVTRETSLCFAGPITERVLGCEHLLGTFSGVQIFVPVRLAQPDREAHAGDWLQSYAHLFAGAVEADGERFQVARNKTVLYVRPRGVPDDIQRLETLIMAVERLPAPDTNTQPPVLPDQFRDLGALAVSWALSEDGERSEAIAGGSDDELKALWRTVAPRLDEIATLLETSDDAAELVVLGDLAQAAQEARHELARRGRTVS